MLFLAGVPGNVQRTSAIVVVNQRAAAKHMVQHTENSLFVSRDDAGGEDNGILWIDADQAVIVDGYARQRRHRLGLTSAG